MHFTAATLLTFALSAISVSADAISSRQSGVDYSPPITSPDRQTFWTSGLTYTVTWNTTLPEGVSQDDVPQTATIKLGYITEDSENLNWTLAEDVPLYTTGSYDVTLPSDLKGKSNYVIGLLGSSGNVSPEFTIFEMFEPGQAAPVAPAKRERKVLRMS
ncbi:hypothetical protein RQP46_000549 [Phenoliferia psychrophenolica]